MPLKQSGKLFKVVRHFAKGSARRPRVLRKNLTQSQAESYLKFSRPGTHKDVIEPQ